MFLLRHWELVEQTFFDILSEEWKGGLWRAGFFVGLKINVVLAIDAAGICIWGGKSVTEVDSSRAQWRASQLLSPPCCLKDPTLHHMITSRSHLRGSRFLFQTRNIMLGQEFYGAVLRSSVLYRITLHDDDKIA
jgi:hypothetical protein